jgi:hypothetical protein
MADELNLRYLRELNTTSASGDAAGIFTSSTIGEISFRWVVLAHPHNCVQMLRSRAAA